VSRAKEVTLESYFFANRNTHWMILGISFLTTSLFSPYFFGLTSSSVTFGVPFFYGLVSVIMLIVLGRFFAPLYLKANINTLPEFFEKRFNRACKFYLSAIYIFLNIFIRLMIIVVTGGVLFNIVAGIDAFSPLVFFLVVTGIYVIIGGLRAEISVSIVQVLLITFGVVGLLGWIIGQKEVVNPLMNKIASVSFFDADVNSEFTWAVLMIGLPIVGMWFWCVDQFMVQKILSVRNISSVNKAGIVSGFLQFIPILIFVLPGFIIITFCQNVVSEDALRTFFSSGILPESIKGGLIIAMVAAITASLASLFNSTSILITFDFYRTLKPASSDRKLVLVGRLTTMVLLFFSILLIIPVSQKMDFIFCLKLFRTFAYFAAMILAIFIISLVNRRINSASALLTLSVGTGLILLRAILEIFYPDQFFGSTLFLWYAKSNFLEFSIAIFLLSTLMLFGFNRTEWIRHAVLKKSLEHS
jgi:SSS family solute:Na+ symporter